MYSSSQISDLLQHISRAFSPLDNIRSEARKQKDLEDEAFSSSLSAIQFCWCCRDGVYSIEAETNKEARLQFDSERRELHVIVAAGELNHDVIAIRYTSITSMSRHFSNFDKRHILFLELEHPPMFLRENLQTIFMDQQSMYSRLSTYTQVDNPRAISFTGSILRLVFRSEKDLNKFSRLQQTAGLRRRHSQAEVPVERRNLFSVARLKSVDSLLGEFDWCVSFQLASLLQNMVLDASELLDLMPRITELSRAHDESYVAGLLAEFQTSVTVLFRWDADRENETIFSCFDSTARGYVHTTAPLVPGDGDFYQSLHVTITPTTYYLEGPFPERSNRVVRRYDVEHHASFLRVTFRDENFLKYRFDRNVNGSGFVGKWAGKYLQTGLQIAGRNFKFLAYSQLALREHSVWFVKGFCDSQRGDVDARSIIESLGTFHNLSYDPELMRCPARYGARISQAFTATDAAKVLVEHIIRLDDIKTEDGKYIYTDGVGTVSTDLARDISRAVGGRPPDFSRVFQIRYLGSKGMLSVDPTLDARSIGLRPSMIKYEAGGNSREHDIEIARAFDRPTPYFLNRPLIMLLEGLGIRYEVFREFQDQAIRHTRDAASTLSKAARLLETHGLGTSFRMPSVMQSLGKLGLESIFDDPFYVQVLKVAVHHVLRDLKHHARIPIPKAWTLVGVADVHRYLGEGEVFACVKQPQGQGVIYLRGPVLISRPPTIHPGDVQLAEAIGPPPENSCFAKEPLYNSIVFSVRGARPLPSCLGGGDLDGDVYNIIPLEVHQCFMPEQIYSPAEYAPAQRKLLPRNSTMDDVAHFVAEYILSDVVGIVATNWLIIADQSQLGILDEDCLKLAQLHSDAVDYPKSGKAVDIRAIPKLKRPQRPDWNAPETINPERDDHYYKSNRAIGRLFRDVELDDIPSVLQQPRRRGKASRRPRRGTQDPPTHTSSSESIDSVVFDLIKDQVEEFLLDSSGPWEESTLEDIARIFKRFSTELAGIAVNCTLSNKVDGMLLEEELIVGTITQKTSQPRTRTEYMTKVRKHTDTLVKGIRREIEGDEDRTLEEYLVYAWLGYKLSFAEVKETFGAKSFGWLALGAIFDAIKQLEEHDLSELGRSGRARVG